MAESKQGLEFQAKTIRTGSNISSTLLAARKWAAVLGLLAQGQAMPLMAIWMLS